LIDWHNFGYSVLSHSLHQSHPFVKVYHWYELLSPDALRLYVYSLPLTFSLALLLSLSCSCSLWYSCTGTSNSLVSEAMLIFVSPLQWQVSWLPTGTSRMYNCSLISSNSMRRCSNNQTNTSNRGFFGVTVLPRHCMIGRQISFAQPTQPNAMRYQSLSTFEHHRTSSL
jgi:hypothetical protein